MLSFVTVRDWDPNEWQAYCEALLTARYGVRVQLIPDRARGDGGLEAYVADESTAFQCYAPESPFSLALQTQAQREKIRADTKKLIDNPTRTRDLIGKGSLIREWVLLTPACEDKSLIVYANSRSQWFISKAVDCDWCAPDFRISVHTDSLFAVERANLFGDRVVPLQSQSAPVDVTDLRSTGAVAPSIEDVLDEKLVSDPRLATDARLFARFKDETIADYFRGQVEMTRLSRDVPTVYKAASACADVVFGGLARSLAESDDRPVIVVGAIRTRLEALLTSRLPGVQEDLIVILARYFIASWWIQCPLQFEGAVNA